MSVVCSTELTFLSTGSSAEGLPHRRGINPGIPITRSEGLAHSFKPALPREEAYLSALPQVRESGIKVPHFTDIEGATSPLSRHASLVAGSLIR